jgi:hypothetical protein
LNAILIISCSANKTELNFTSFEIKVFEYTKSKQSGMLYVMDSKGEIKSEQSGLLSPQHIKVEIKDHNTGNNAEISRILFSPKALDHLKIRFTQTVIDRSKVSRIEKEVTSNHVIYHIFMNQQGEDTFNEFASKYKIKPVAYILDGKLIGWSMVNSPIFERNLILKIPKEEM